MKNLFNVNDDWEENPKILTFNTKIKTQKHGGNKNQLIKNIKNADETKNEKNVVDKSMDKFENKKNKSKSKKLLQKLDLQSKNELNREIENNEEFAEGYNGGCLFTPLIRKNKSINDDHDNLSNGNKNNQSMKTIKSNEDVSTKFETGKKRKKTINEEETKAKNPKMHENKTENTDEKNINNKNFVNKLRENLMGGRFRFLNEQLYIVPGSEAKKLFQEDKLAFKTYHDGYRKQIEKWPFNPLDRIIKRVRKLPKHMIIADFGCGEGKLAESISHKCHSIDLVSMKPNVIACDMANTTLKSESIDVAIYCLSLMGTNLQDFICEANRVLKKDGTVFVAEIASRFDNVRDFKKLWEHLGFELLRQDVDKKNFFYFFDFKKVENVKKNLMTIEFCSLKPCIYKKR